MPIFLAKCLFAKTPRFAFLLLAFSPCFILIPKTSAGSAGSGELVTERRTIDLTDPDASGREQDPLTDLADIEEVSLTLGNSVGEWVDGVTGRFWLTTNPANNCAGIPIIYAFHNFAPTLP